MSRQAAAQRRHSTAQSPQSGWCDECCSQTLAHRSQISAQARHSNSVEGDSLLIQRVESAQRSAQSMQSLMQSQPFFGAQDLGWPFVTADCGRLYLLIPIEGVFFVSQP